MDLTTNIPHDLNAERVILGCILLDRKARMCVLNSIQFEDFFHPPHGILFTAMAELSDQGIPPDYITLTNKLKNEESLSAVGGPEYMAGLTNVVPTVRNAEHYCGIVSELSRRRQLIKIGHIISQTALNPKGEDSKSIMNEALTGLLSVDRSKATERAQNIAETARASRQYAEGVVTGKTKNTLSVGYTALDEILGLTPGNVMVIGGRTSEGKTALALNICKNVAYEGSGILFLSAEMTVMELDHRFASLITGLPIADFRYGKYYLNANDTREPYEKAIARLADRIYIKHIPGASDIDITRIVKRELIEHPQIQLIVIDYLQLLSCEMERTRYIPKGPAMSIISRAIKRLAGEIEKQIILVSQIARPPDHARSKNPPPTRYSLKESGDIENDADIIILLYLQENTDDDKHLQLPIWLINLIIAKNRNGRTGICAMNFIRNQTKFQEQLEAPV